MTIEYGLLRQIESDLQLKTPYVKGELLPVKNCWHFSTDGNAVDVMFYNASDFRDGMNRVYVVSRNYNVIILCFVLMGNHLHFVLYGNLDECTGFVHEYVRRTSQYIMERHLETNKLNQVPVNYQVVDTDRYLKTVICYVIKNPSAAGLPYFPWTYPWSSGYLYFLAESELDKRRQLSDNVKIIRSEAEKRRILRTRDVIPGNITIIDGIVPQEEYVAYDIVKQIYKTPKSLLYFLGKSNDDEVEAKGGLLSYLSMPLQELRQHRDEFCNSLFSKKTIKYLDMHQRLTVARLLKRNFNSSPKQIAKVCGLKYDEVRGFL